MRIKPLKNKSYTFQFDPKKLINFGPILNARVQPNESRSIFLEKQGKAIEELNTNFLLDTGAASCLILPGIAAKLNLKYLGKMEVIGLGGRVPEAPVYLADIALNLFIRKKDYFEQAQIFFPQQLVEVDFPSGHGYEGIIGRDVLSHFDLRINGFTGALNMRFLGWNRPV